MSDTNINDGGPAFPVLRESGNPDMPLFMASAGMSLRDWFAGQAIGGIVSSSGWNCQIDMGAKDAFAIADAMLAARERK